MSELSRIEEHIGYRFKNASLLQEAMTHPSAPTEGEVLCSNQRLEFLGDAVLELLVSEILYRENPTAPEGRMTPARASLVCGASFAAIAAEIRLGDALILGPAARKNRLQENAAALEDALEALFGAVYLDGGLDAARSVCATLFHGRSFDVESYVSSSENPKGTLQEIIQSDPGAGRLEYEIVTEDGPPHQRTFAAVVKLQGEVRGRGRGNSKRAAETEAARDALARRSS